MWDGLLQAVMFILGFFSDRLLTRWQQHDSFRNRLSSVRGELLYNAGIMNEWPTPRFQEFPFILSKATAFVQDIDGLFPSQECFRAILKYLNSMEVLRQSWAGLYQHWHNRLALKDTLYEELKKRVAGTELLDQISGDFEAAFEEVMAEMEGGSMAEEVDGIVDAVITAVFPILKAAVAEIEKELHIPPKRRATLTLTKGALIRGMMDASMRRNVGRTVAFPQE